MIRAGAAEVIITPPIGVELGGYGPHRFRYSTHIHSHLMAQALVVDNGQTQIAIVSADLLRLTSEFTAKVRNEAARQTGISPGNIMVACSHTHTAPGTGGTRPEFGGADRHYIHSAARHLAGAVVVAANNLQDVSIHAGQAQHPELAWNRLGGSEVDATVRVIRFALQSGETLALLVHYACHPVILGPKTIISSDYPGAMRAYVKTQYPGSIVLFANGACADIDPVTNRDQWGQGTTEDVEHAGVALGNRACQAAAQPSIVKPASIAVAAETLRLDYELPSLETIRAKMAYYQSQIENRPEPAEHFQAVTGLIEMPDVRLRYYRALQERIQKNRQPAHEFAELQRIAFGEHLAIVAIPAEVFTAQGMAIRSRSKYAHTIPVCYANGLYGYLPPHAEFESGSYAATVSPIIYNHPAFRPGVAEQLVDACESLVTK